MLPKQIHSLQHPIVKLLVNLRKNAKDREEKTEVLVTGKKIIFELAKKLPCKKILFAEGFHGYEKLEAEEVYSANDAILKKISGMQSYSDQIVATFPLPQEKQQLDKGFILALDGISDPGNMGTIFRTACAFGVDGVFLLPGCVDLFNEKVLRAAKGANFTVPFCRMGQKEFVSWSKKDQRQLLIADMQGKDVCSFDFEFPTCLVLSSEAHGVSSSLKDVGTAIKIPMTNEMESLNVATAGAILLHHMRNAHG